MPARSATPKLIAALLAAGLLLAACAQPPAPGPTLPPAATRQPSATPQPTFTPTPTSTPTLTPMPTLPSDEAQALAMALLKDETDCHLPCWFGVTVGETTWPEANNLFKTFSYLFEYSGSEDDPGREFGEMDYFYITIPVPKSMDFHGEVTQVFSVEDNIITSIWGRPGFILAHLLSTYGKPAEVWVRVNTFGAPPFEVFMSLFYPEKNMLATFIRRDAPYARSGVISTCVDAFQEESYNFILDIWSSDHPKSWRSFQPFNSWDTAPPPLEDAIGMDLDTFYETYKNPDVEPCFEFPDDVWPHPNPLLRNTDPPENMLSS